eukprot:GDKK01068755.1.p1 GENE.GDKK01068755.1~~GDKK01068755.1.p1  ORF type:complete len:149 (+),score=2.84 GDKK01068755.1:208-654(+)
MHALLGCGARSYHKTKSSTPHISAIIPHPFCFSCPFISVYYCIKYSSDQQWLLTHTSNKYNKTISPTAFSFVNDYFNSTDEHLFIFSHPFYYFFVLGHTTTLPIHIHYHNDVLDKVLPLPSFSLQYKYRQKNPLPLKSANTLIKLVVH